MSTDGSQDIPEPIQPPEPVRQAIIEYYHDHKEFYEKPWSQLDQVKRRFESGDERLRASLLALSYIYAVFTIRATYPEPEVNFRQMMEGKTMKQSMIDGANMPGKADDMNRAFDGLWPEQFVEWGNRMANGNVADVVKEMDDTYLFLRISSVKAPFVAANLGYTSEMCVDSNVQTLSQIDLQQPSREVQQEVCARVIDNFPELRSEVEQDYHLQWILFNFTRVMDVFWDQDTGWVNTTFAGSAAVKQIEGKEPAAHEEWFNYALADRDVVVNRVEEIVAEARGAVGEEE